MATSHVSLSEVVGFDDDRLDEFLSTDSQLHDIRAGIDGAGVDECRAAAAPAAAAATSAATAAAAGLALHLGRRVPRQVPLHAVEARVLRAVEIANHRP